MESTLQIELMNGGGELCNVFTYNTSVDLMRPYNGLNLLGHGFIGAWLVHEEFNLMGLVGT